MSHQFSEFSFQNFSEDMTLTDYDMTHEQSPFKCLYNKSVYYITHDPWICTMISEFFSKNVFCQHRTHSEF